MAYLDYVQSRESGGDPYAKNPRSSALGPFQFIDSTWNDLMSRRPDLGLTADGRTDPEQARRAAGAFTQENEGVLRKAGYEPDDNMRYLAHRFGAQGALSLLRAPADAPVANVVGQGVLSANPDLAGKSVGALTRAQAFTGEPEASPYAATEGVQAINRAMRQPTNSTFMSAPDTSSKKDKDYGFANRLAGAGASLMAITNPHGAKAMTEQLRQESDDADQYSLTLDPQTGAVFRINKRTGDVALSGNPLGQRKVSDATLLKANDELAKYGQLHGVSEQANDVLQKLRDGTLKLGVIKNAENKLKNGLGLSDDESRAYAQWDQFKQQYSYMKQLEAKGVQTEGDAKRAMEMLVAGGANFDDKAAQDALERLIRANGRSQGNARKMLDSFRSQAPGTSAFDPYVQELDARDRWYAERASEAEARRKGSTLAPAAGGGSGGSRILNVR